MQKMGTIKDRNSKDLTEVEDIKKKWQAYTEELYKRNFNELDNFNGMATHLESDILECEVKWALGSITTNKASGQSYPTLCDPMNCSMPGLPVHHQFLEFTQTHVHRAGSAIQLSHPLSSRFPPALNPSQHQSLFQ